MSRIKRLIVRYVILSKRLLHRPGFVAVLVLIPLAVLAMIIATSGKDSSIVNVAVAMEDENDITAREIIESLLDDKGLISFVPCRTSIDAVDMVKNGKADAAWIFAEDLESKIAKFSNHTHKNNAFVTVVQREDNVFLRLSHEKLNTVLYPYISLAVYRSYLRDSIIDISQLSEQELDSFYNAVNAEGEDLFEFTYAGREGEPNRAADNKAKSFLISPLRGILAIMVMVAGVAVSMFHVQDDEKGAFAGLSRGIGFSFAALYHLSAVMMEGLIVFAALLFTRITVGFGFELLVLLIYCVCVTGFCICLRFVFPDTRVLGFVTPLLIIVTAVVCPIFFAAPRLPMIQYLLPTYYYIRALTNINFVWYMVLYTVVLYLIAFALYILHSRKKKT